MPMININERIKIDETKKTIWIFKNEAWRQVKYTVDNNWNIQLGAIDPSYIKASDIGLALSALAENDTRYKLPDKISIGNLNYVFDDNVLKPAVQDPDNPGTYISTEDALIQGGTAAEAAAKAENEIRYQEGIAGYTSLRNRVMTGIQNLGQQQAIDTRRNFMNLASQTQQSAMKRGLSGTTIVPAMNQGIQRQQSDALNNLAQNVSTQRSNFDIQTTGLLEGFRERRTDAYPNLDMPLQLLLRQAAGGAT